MKRRRAPCANTSPEAVALRRAAFEFAKGIGEPCGDDDDDDDGSRRNEVLLSAAFDYVVAARKEALAAPNVGTAKEKGSAAWWKEFEAAAAKSKRLSRETGEAFAKLQQMARGRGAAS